MAELTIGGKSMPPVKSLSVSAEKIWSKNTGRVASGKMAGDLVAIKMKLSVEFAPLNDSQAAKVDDAISKAFFDVKFKNPRTGKEETHRMYAGSATYPVYSYVNGLPRYVGTKVDLIEQ